MRPFHSLVMCLMFGFVAAVNAGSRNVVIDDAELISNGNFETDANADHSPDGWATLENGTWIEEGGNHFLRLRSPAPDKMVMLYQEIAIPENVEALELTRRQRVTGLRKGELPWYDARIMLDCLGIDGKKISQPSPP